MMRTGSKTTNNLGYPELIETTHHFRGAYEVVDKRVPGVMMVAVFYDSVLEVAWGDMSFSINGEKMNKRFGEDITDILGFSSHAQAWATKNGRMALTRAFKERRSNKTQGATEAP